MDFQGEVYIFKGTVLQPNIDTQFATSDGPGSSVLDLSSVVGGKNAVTKYGKGTPKYSKLYSIKFSMKDEQGRVHVCAFPSNTLSALRIEVNEGDKVSIICSKKTDYTLRLINRTTGRAWAIAYGRDLILESKVGGKVSFALVTITAYITALVRSAPIINFFDIIFSWLWLQRQYIPPSAKLKILLLISTCLYLSSYFIILGTVQHAFGEHPSTKITKTAAFKLKVLPLAPFANGELHLFSDEESNLEFADFYHSESYDPNKVSAYLFYATFLWLVLVSLVGTMIQGTFINLLRKDQMYKQMYLDQLSCKAIAEG